MGSETRQVHVFFFPFMAQGHMIPVIDMAKIFASRGVKSSIITTPHNAPIFSKTIEISRDSGIDIDIQIIKFPTVEVGLPEGCENSSKLKSNEMREKFFKGVSMLQQPLEQLLQEQHPDCLVADMFFPWATDAASKFDIPRLIFHGTSFFSMCTAAAIGLYEPHKKVSSDTETFIIPSLPHEIKLTKTQLPDFVKNNEENGFTKMFARIRESELTSYGIIFNSFYELEPDYADHYRKVLGRKAWHIGPVSVCNKGTEEKSQRGEKASIDELECLEWLDSKKPNSVVYVCFGSSAMFPAPQLHEIAMGLESSGQEFIWVVRKGNEEEENEEWLPEGFEDRIKGKGLIIRGWAPQVLILDHGSVGGFVTHCGWNSTLEGVSAGVPMVTWPVFAEQFYNEKLVTEILRIGVGVGAQKWGRNGGDSLIKREAIEKAVSRVMMVGEEAEEMRSRAMELGKMARKAIEEGGSSYSDLNPLIEELRLRGH